MRYALAIGTFLILAIHGVVLFNQFSHRWERNQIAYFDQARAMAKTDSERAALAERAPRIEQIVVANFGETRVDRCTTCHIAADDPRFDKHAQPLKTHPYSLAMGDTEKDGKWERRHKFSEFGCTVCHDGQGRGLQPEYSHGEDEFWPDPLLGYTTQSNWRKDFVPKLKGREYLEANCAQCHPESGFKGTPTVARGRELFFASNCYGCHRIEGMSDGTIGPDLSEVGRKFKVDYIYGRIADPKSILATSIMPQFKLAEADIKALTVFLKSRKGKNFAETEIQRYKVKSAGGSEMVQANLKPVTAAGQDLVKLGERLVVERACAACHKVAGKDGGIAPDLSFEGSLKDEAWIAEHFKNPRSVMPDSIMPAFKFTDLEFKAMTAYLSGLRSGPTLAGPEATYKSLCLRCHGEKGDGLGPIAAHLDPSPRDLTKDGFMNSKSEARLLHSVRFGVAGTSMPAWNKLLSEDQAKAVLGYVQTTFTKEPRRELKARTVPERNPVPLSAESIARGQAQFVERCAGCHGKKGDGKGPNSLDILPKPRNLRNPWFVDSVDDRRLFESILYGVQGTAMPPWVDYGLNDQNVGDLVNFIRNLNPKPKGVSMQQQISRAELAGANAPEGALVHEDLTARWFVVSSVAYFFIVGIIALVIAAKFCWPELMGTTSWLTYGRLRPLHVNGMLFGWLLAADMGLAYYVFPRLCGVKLWSEKLGIATAILWNVIILGAVVSLMAGRNQGLEYAELEPVLDVLVVVAWIMFGANLLMTVATRKHQAMYVTIWYVMGCILWTAFVYLTGNFAVLFTTGVNQANLNWMYVHNAVGLIFTPIGLGLAYYFIPRASNTPLYSHKLSMVGFWSLAFVYVWTGAHHMIHGPISQWLQTIAIAFSLMLLIPVWAVVYNFFATMKGQWHQLRDSVPLKFLLSGIVFYLLTCFQGPMHSLRTVSAIVSKTDWIPGHAHMAVFGCFSFLAIAGTYFTVPRMFGKQLFSDALANWSYWMMMIGGLGFFVTLWLGGFWQGWQWNNVAIPFIDTVVALKPIWLVRFFSGAMIFSGIVMFAYNVMATVLGPKQDAAA